MKNVLFIFIGAILLLFFLNIFFESTSFASESWRRGDTRVKAKMVNDLINKDILVGKNKEEVMKLIGNPTQTPINENSDEWVYPLDKRYFLFIKPSISYSLVVRFDGKTNIVTTAYVAD